jgi:hypothetical protein
MNRTGGGNSMEKTIFALLALFSITLNSCLLVDIAELIFKLTNQKKENIDYYDFNNKENLEYFDFSNIELKDNGVTILFDFNIIDSVTFIFVYNSDYYKMIFHGKDSIIGFHIEKNNMIDENTPLLMLDLDENGDKFIIEELNKSPLFNAWNEREIVNIGIMYQIKYFDKNVLQTTLVQIVPTDELTNYLIELIDRYYLPLKVE